MQNGSYLTRFLSIPKTLSFGPLSVFIDGDFIRAIHIEKKGKFLDISYHASMKVPKSQEKAISLSLSRIVKESSSKYITFVLPEKDSYISKVELPNESLSSVREAVGYKLEEYIPLSLGESVFDFEVLPHHDDHVDVSVSAAPTSKVEELVGLALDARSRVVAVVAEPVALVKSLITSREVGDTLIVHLSSSQITFVIVRSALPMFSSSLVTDFSIPANKKEIITSGKAKDALQAVKALFGGALEETKRISGWWKNRIIKDEAEERGQINKVVVSGEAALLPGLASLFGEYADAEVVIGNPWVNFNLPLNYIPKISRAEALSLVPVIGASLMNNSF